MVLGKLVGLFNIFDCDGETLLGTFDDDNDIGWVDEKTARLDQTNMLCPLLAEKRYLMVI